jgi:hopanoid C-3 methylase
VKILLVNPPNCGKSIPEEKYGIDSIKQIFRGEPLALESLAGNLMDHEVRILDLKADPEGLAVMLEEFSPDVAGITGVTCEANTVISIAREIKQACNSKIVVGGIHASNDPKFYNKPEIDYIAIGIARASFRELIEAFVQDRNKIDIAGIAATYPGKKLNYTKRQFSQEDLVNHKPPAYELVAGYRDNYILQSLKLEMGFVASAFGCPYDCSFCCISGLTGGKYLTCSIDSVIRDIGLLGEIPVIRLLDANTYGNPGHAEKLATAIIAADLNKNFLADVRSDTVVKYPELMKLWKQAGLRAVIIGFEEIDDTSLKLMNKSNKAANNSKAIEILHEIGITIIGDFIISPDYSEKQFQSLDRYVKEHAIDLPMHTILTPLPGTKLHKQISDQVIIDNLDYYTLTNAVLPTRLPEKVFYENYAELLKVGHQGAKL